MRMILAKKGSHTAAETTVHTIKAKATVATTVKTTVRIAVPTVDQNEVTLQTFNVFKLEKKQMKLPKPAIGTVLSGDSKEVTDTQVQVWPRGTSS